MLPDAENRESGLARNGVGGGVKEFWVGLGRECQNFHLVLVELVVLGLLGTRLSFGLSIQSEGPGGWIESADGDREFEFAGISWVIGVLACLGVDIVRLPWC